MLRTQEAPPCQHRGLTPLEVGRSPPMGPLEAKDDCKQPGYWSFVCVRVSVTNTSSPVGISSRPGPAFQAWCCSSSILVYLFGTLKKKKKVRSLRAETGWNSHSTRFSPGHHKYKDSYPDLTEKGVLLHCPGTCRSSGPGHALRTLR